MLNKQGLTPLDLAINAGDDKRALYLIDKMKMHSIGCSLKFVKKPNRLDLKFEKSYVLSILKNNSVLLESFPPKSL